MSSKALSLLSLSLRAGKAAFGEEQVMAVIRDRKARVAVLASDAAENTAKKLRRAAEEASVPVLTLHEDREALGKIFGRETCAVAAVMDIGLAAALAGEFGSDGKNAGPAAQVMEKARKIAWRKKKKPGK